MKSKSLKKIIKAKKLSRLSPPTKSELRYWESIKHINIGKGSLLQLLLDERAQSR